MAPIASGHMTILAPELGIGNARNDFQPAIGLVIPVLHALGGVVQTRQEETVFSSGQETPLTGIHQTQNGTTQLVHVSFIFLLLRFGL
jgi:hypothetical protein